MFEVRAGMLELAMDMMYERGMVDNPECACGQAAETMSHFLFACPKQEKAREIRARAGITRVSEALCFEPSLTEAEVANWGATKKEIPKK